MVSNASLYRGELLSIFAPFNKKRSISRLANKINRGMAHLVRV